MWLLHNVLPFLIILSVLVFVHELGHFWVARKNGVRVDVFSIGFGPELFGFTDKQNTRWRFSIIPLGGYVKFFGDQDVSSTTSNTQHLTDQEKSQTLSSKSPMQRMAVAFAGPAANYIFAWAILVVLISFKGIPVYTPSVGIVHKETLAEKIGLRPDDIFERIGDELITTFEDIKSALVKNAGKDVVMTIKRQGQQIQLPVSLIETDIQGKKKSVSRLGITPGEPQYEQKNVFAAAFHALTVCANLTQKMITDLVTLLTKGKEAGELGGIIAIGDMAAKSVQQGLSTVLWLMALLSINLGLINLFPLPVLDGGHILLCAIEKVRGKALTDKVQEAIFTIGLVLVGGLMLYATWSDLMRYKVFQMIGSFFK
jgi:regulator of sigma E protease